MLVTPAPVPQRRLEALAIMLGAVLAYARLDASWALFAALFFVPDLSIAAYLAGPRVGGVAYNLAHFYGGPFLLGLVAVLGVAPQGALAVALVWTAHVAFDRVLGWGLKTGDSFVHTDMGLKVLPVSVPMLEARPE